MQLQKALPTEPMAANTTGTEYMGEHQTDLSQFKPEPSHTGAIFLKPSFLPKLMHLVFCSYSVCHQKINNFGHNQLQSPWEEGC